MNRWNPALCCTRCHKPILSDTQVCWWKGQAWPCVRADDQTVIVVDGLQVKTGDNRGCGGPPIETAPNGFDPYHLDGNTEQ